MPMISKDLLDILACPVCKSGLSETESGELKCSGCGRIYPIRDGIPILLAEESKLA